MRKPILITTSFILMLIFSLNTLGQQHLTLSDYPDEIKKTNKYKRFEWLFTQRAFPYDTIPAVHANSTKNSEIQKIKKESSQYKDQQEWYPLGPSGFDCKITYWGQVSGRIRGVAVHPTDPLTIYIGAATGGLWKSTDGGDTWQDIGKHLESLTFGAIAIDPNNPQTIYAGSGELGYFGDVYDGMGLFKSTDGGDTWTHITNGFGNITHFSNIVVCPFDSDILLASLAGGTFNVYPSLDNEGIWKSTDAGETWTKKLDGPFGSDVTFHPTDENLAYACIGGKHFGSGFYISEDQGESWTVSNSGMASPNTISRMHMDISESNPDTIYAVVYDTPGAGAYVGETTAWKSENGGLNWSQISPGVELGGHFGFDWVDQGFYDLCIVVDPADPNHVLIGNIELHETFDGDNFSVKRPFGYQNILGGFTHNDIHKMVFAPTDPSIFYVACDGGLYQSTDNCATAVSKNTGLESLQFYRMGSHPTNPEVMIGGMQDNGSVMTTDGGNSWDQVLRGDGMSCFFDLANPDDIIYASRQQGELLKSTNGGTSFSFFHQISGGAAWVTPFIQHPEGDTLYAANKDIHRYDGSSWVAIGLNAASVLINDLAQSKVNPQHMILAAGGSAGGFPFPDTLQEVKISTDGAYTWTDVTGNIPGEIRLFSSVVPDPVDENTMYAVKCGYSEGNKIFKTTDLGVSWTNVSGDLPDIPCNDLFIDPEKPLHYYVATDLGVYFSGNEGQTWEYTGDGLPFVIALDFDYVHIDNVRYLRIATHGRSIYETILPNYCLSDGITFSTQDEIDNFQTNYPFCTEIEGDVEISGEDITNLYGLYGLTSLGGDLRIYGNDVLTNLTGMDNLTSIEGSLIIGDHDGGNPLLTSISGLNSLNYIGGNLGFYNNPSLTSLTGLENLSSIPGSLAIGSYVFGGNPSLSSLSGLDGLTFIGGGLNIEINDSLSSLSGLNSLTSIGGSVYIGGNLSLTSLAGLDSLASIGGDLYIGFSGMMMTQWGNPSLTSLTGLENVAPASITDLIIRYNDTLSDCAISSICDYLSAPNGIVIIGDNATGCDNQSQVWAACNVSVNETEPEIHNTFTISPNPLQSATLIHYNLPQTTAVSLKILDLTGKIVASLVNEIQQEGDHQMTYNTKGLPAGIYFCVLQTNPGSLNFERQTKKMIKL